MGQKTEPTGERGSGPSGDPVVESIETILRIDNADLQRRTWADLLADHVAGFTGSIYFVILHLTWFGLWTLWNTGLLMSAKPFDPFPLQLLSVIVSLEGVLLVTFVLIKQNRMAYLSDRRAHWACRSIYSPNVKLPMSLECCNAWRTSCNCLTNCLKIR